MKSFYNNLINSSPDIWNIYSVEALAWNVCTSHVFAVSTMGTLRHTETKTHTHTQQNEIEGEGRDKVTQETCGSGAGTLRKTGGWIMDARFQQELQMFEKEKGEKRTATEQSTARPYTGNLLNLSWDRNAEMFWHEQRGKQFHY